MLILQYKTGTLVVYNFETPASIPELIPFVGDANVFTHKNISSLTPVVSGDDNTFSVSEAPVLTPAVESTGTETGGQQDPNAWWLTEFVETFCDPGSGNTIQFSIGPPTWYTPSQVTNTSLGVGIGDPCTP